jgi:hypothetical protein
VKFVGLYESRIAVEPRSGIRRWVEARALWLPFRKWVAKLFRLEVPTPPPSVSIFIVCKGPFDEGLVRDAHATIESTRAVGVSVDVKAWWEA